MPNLKPKLSDSPDVKSLGSKVENVKTPEVKPEAKVEVKSEVKAKELKSNRRSQSQKPKSISRLWRQNLQRLRRQNPRFITLILISKVNLDHLPICQKFPNTI